MIPQHTTLHYRLVSAFHWDEWTVKHTDETWARDILTHDRWSKWIDNDLFERLRNEPEKKPKAKRETLSRKALHHEREWLESRGMVIPPDFPEEAMADLLQVDLSG